MSNEQIDWSAKLARAGYLVVVGCWNATWICLRPPASDAADRLVDLAEALPDARKGLVALVGLGNQGGVIAINTAAHRDDIGAIVSDTGVSPGDVPKAPILLFSSDSTADAVQAYATALRDHGVVVETKTFTPGSQGNVMVLDTQGPATEAILSFLGKNLGR